MSQTKTLAELTIKNNFLFSAVMLDPENCRGLLEIVLGIPIDRVIVSREQCLIYHPEYRSVRLDIYARDSRNTHYNVEMQVSPKPALTKRCRYYHSQMDMGCFWPEQIIQGFRIPMSFLSVILIPSADKDIYTPLKTAVWKTDKSC